MKFKEYVKEALKTECSPEDVFGERINKLGWTSRLEHALIGIVSEKEELDSALNQMVAIQQIKTAVLNDEKLKKEQKEAKLKELEGKEEFLRINIGEEIGDILWYYALALDEFDLVKEFDVFLEANKKNPKLVITDFVSKEMEKSGRTLEDILTLSLPDITKRIKFYYTEVNDDTLRRVKEHKTDFMLYIFLSFFALKQLIKTNDLDIDKILEANIAKLNFKRYKKGAFDVKDALYRNVEDEYELLKQILGGGK